MTEVISYWITCAIVSSLHFNSKPLVVDCLQCIIRLQVKLSNTYSIRARYAAAKRPSLSWLSVSFFLHVKYTVSYRIVDWQLAFVRQSAAGTGIGYPRVGYGSGRHWSCTESVLVPKWTTHCDHSWTGSRSASTRRSASLLCIDYELSLNMALSEPQYSLCCTIKETDSKAEQGNDNLIACDSNDDLTATENNSTKSVTLYKDRQSRI